MVPILVPFAFLTNHQRVRRLFCENSRNHFTVCKAAVLIRVLHRSVESATLICHSLRLNFKEGQIKMDYKEIVTLYLTIVDESIELLSKNNEGKISNLPGWVLHNRQIDIGVTKDSEGIVVKITPDDSLGDDVSTIQEVTSVKEINNLLAPEPMKYGDRMPNTFPENRFDTVSNIRVVHATNPLVEPPIHIKSFLGFGRVSGFINHFNEKEAKLKAIDLWNSAANDLDTNESYILQVRNVVDKFQAIIKRKGFLERSIHRFVNEHKAILLPDHKVCRYEHCIYLRDEMRKADFILEREQGLPAIFIELENPVHRVFTKNGDLTAQSNHASQQVSEWVKFVEEEPQTNATGEYSFLTGHKERMVIIGTGVENREKLIDT